MKAIQYIKGDATCPVGDDNKIIIHCCNDCVPGRWGKGFVLALNKWPQPKSEYMKWSRQGKNSGYELGNLQFVKVEDDIVVCNMIGQRDTKPRNGVTPIRYSAISKCLEKIAVATLRNNASIHCPRFGSGLAGGSWDIIETLIKEHLCDQDIQVTVYDI